MRDSIVFCLNDTVNNKIQELRKVRDTIYFEIIPPDDESDDGSVSDWKDNIPWSGIRLAS